jgi:hydroxymethylpyrimidine kinase/phosphomethylpyrimidine kinase
MNAAPQSSTRNRQPLQRGSFALTCGSGKHMSQPPTWPLALTIAGSDSGGGAGIQADLKTFAAFGVHGTCAIACLTAQNPRRVLAVQPCSPRLLRQQIDAVWEELPPRAMKTGLLYSAANLRAVAGFFAALPARSRVPLVVDPLMVATSGAVLLAAPARRVLETQLLPLATLATPNLDEVAALLGQRPRSADEMQAAARAWHDRFGCAVLVKGGHLPGAGAIDVFYDGNQALTVTARRIPGVRTHGTGCTYSAAICAALALGHPLPTAVQMGKRFITSAIEHSVRIAGHWALGWAPVTPNRRWPARSGR